MSYIIENAGVGMAENAAAPESVPVIGEVAFRDEEGTLHYLCLVEVEGCPNFYLGDRSILTPLMNGDNVDFIEDYMNENYQDYDDYFNIFADDALAATELYEIYMYLIYLVRCPSGDDEIFLNETMGKDVEEIEIPVSDVEEDYMTFMEDEEAQDEAWANEPLIPVSEEMHEFFELARRKSELSEIELNRYRELIEILG